MLAARLANPQPHLGKIDHLTGPQSENRHFFAQEYSKALGRTTGLRVFWNGYLPPAEFVPQLLVAQAQTLLRLQGEPGAAAVYRQVLERFPTSAVAPEAQYSAAVALYKHSHQAPDLLDTWRRLQTQYPSSIWRVKQSFTEQG